MAFCLNNPHLPEDLEYKTHREAKKAAQYYADEYNLIVGINYKIDWESIKERDRKRKIAYAIMKTRIKTNRNKIFV